MCYIMVLGGVRVRYAVCGWLVVDLAMLGRCRGGGTCCFVGPSAG